MLSKKTKYAIKVLVALSKREEEDPIMECDLG